MVLMVFLVWMAEMELMEVLVCQENMYALRELRMSCVCLHLTSSDCRVRKGLLVEMGLMEILVMKERWVKRYKFQLVCSSCLYLF